MTPEAYRSPEASREMTEWFKLESLKLLAGQLAVTPHANYPTLHDRLWVPAEDLRQQFYPIRLPLGTWETSDGALPRIPEQLEFAKQGLQLDAYGRPLHPWFETMLSDPTLEIVTGRGSYWHWGPNYTADSVVLRHDRTEPRLLLVQRDDGTDMWALPGGYLDAGEDSVTAAVREVSEETQRIGDSQPTVPLAALGAVATAVYQGPVADIRMTANAWPETTAYRFDLTNEAARHLPLGPYTVKEDEEHGAKQAAWVSLNDIPPLFGSHELLVKRALEERP